MEQQEYEREIDLKNLFYHILLRWKLMVIVALVCMAGLGAYKFVSVLRANRAAAEAEAEAELEEEEEEIDYVKMAQDAMDGLVDPNTLGGDTLLYYNQLVKLKQYDTDIQNREFSLQNSKSVLAGREQQLAGLEQVVLEDVDPENAALLINQRNSMESSVLSSKNEIASLERDLETLAKNQKEAEDSAAILKEELIKQAEKENEEAEEEEEAASMPIKPTIKFAIIGLLGGGFMMAFFFCMIYLFSGKLLDLAVLPDAYGLRVLSVVRTEQAKKGIDGWIEKLSGYGNQTAEEAYDVLYARLLNLSGSLEGRTILLTSTADESAVKALQSYLQNKDSSAKFVVCQNPLHNMDTILNLKEADDVVLVECVGKSELQEIRQVLQYMTDVEKAPLGAVIMA